MSIANFVPEIWSRLLQRHLDANLVYALHVNRNWEGEISDQGDTVHIQKVGSPEIVNYVKGTPMTPERPEGTTQALTIDRDKGYYIQMDDLDAIQANVPLFERYAQRAGIEMAKTIDEDIATRQVAGAGIEVGADADPIVIGSGVGADFASFYAFVLECRRNLDNNEAPDESRWMKIPPDLEALALDDDRFIPAGAEEQRTGVIGRIAGLTLYKTTRVPTSPGTASPNWKVLFGAGDYSTTFANQLVETEAERLQGLFEDAIKGRNVWGCKVVEPETLGVAHFTRVVEGS